MNRRPTPTVDLSPDPKLAGCLPATAPLAQLAEEQRRFRAALQESPGSAGPCLPLALCVCAAHVVANPVPILLGRAPVVAARPAGPCIGCGGRVEA